jgi:asparagine synthase (glutamine-hydrolysing)
MCGIFLYITQKEIPNTLIKNTTKLLLHRGPDNQNHTIIKFNKWNILLLHTRLQINGNIDLIQPFYDSGIYLLINGEIFNYLEIEKQEDFTGPRCRNDCEVVLKLYKKYKNSNDKTKDIFNKLNGQFAFVILDLNYKNPVFLAARDHVGIVPMYYGTKINDNLEITDYFITSELKCLTQNIDSPENFYESSICSNINIFYPRTFQEIHTFSKYLKVTKNKWLDYTEFVSEENCPVNAKQNIKTLLINSVRSQLVDLIRNNIEFGVLVSGGLDSSLICSIIISLQKEFNSNGNNSLMRSCVKTFSIGMSKNSEDLKYARKVAEFLNTNHTEYIFSSEEGLSEISNVIWAIETFDTTSIRASTPMYLLAKKIKKDNPNLKVLFSGEGVDELFLSYRYGRFAPDDKSFLEENINLISNIHRFDSLRANKSCMAHNLEIRVPFLDKYFVDYIMKLPISLKKYNCINYENIMEKQILREAFENYLPKEVLWRIKEPFSDGVSSEKDNWIENIKIYAQKIINSKLIKVDGSVNSNKLKSKNLERGVESELGIVGCKALTYIYLRPKTFEQLFYREVFCNLFTNSFYKNTSELTVKFWEPKWCNTKDPSAKIYSKKLCIPKNLSIKK